MAMPWPADPKMQRYLAVLRLKLRVLCRYLEALIPPPVLMLNPFLLSKASPYFHQLYILELRATHPFLSSIRCFPISKVSGSYFPHIALYQK